MKLGPISACLFSLPFLVASAAAQGMPANSPITSGAPVPYASVNELNQVLAQLEHASQGSQLDLAKLRIEKWKTDANTKHGTQSDVDSLQRNLESALPEIIGQLRASPENLAVTFTLYHNLNALYEVFTSVVESAGAFGTKDEFQGLQNDLSLLERARRSVADRMQTLSDAKESEISRLRGQIVNLQSSMTAEPAKKVVVDDTAPPKPPVKKKPAVKKVPKPSTATPPQPGSDSQTQPPPKNPQAPSQPQ
jgi:hypothetical protein